MMYFAPSYRLILMTVNFPATLPTTAGHYHGGRRERSARTPGSATKTGRPAPASAPSGTLAQVAPRRGSSTASAASCPARPTADWSNRSHPVVRRRFIFQGTPDTATTNPLGGVRRAAPRHAGLLRRFRSPLTAQAGRAIPPPTCGWLPARADDKVWPSLLARRLDNCTSAARRSCRGQLIQCHLTDLTPSKPDHLPGHGPDGHDYLRKYQAD